MAEQNIETTTQETGGQEVQGQAKEGKTFSQEEVNGFIQARLGQMKKQAAKEVEAEYSAKLKEISDREMKLLVKEQLQERGMPKDLADIITCTDADDLRNKLDVLQNLYGQNEKKEQAPSGFVQVGAGNVHDAHIIKTDPVRKAMGLE